MIFKTNLFNFRLSILKVIIIAVFCISIRNYTSSQSPLPSENHLLEKEKAIEFINKKYEANSYKIDLLLFKTPICQNTIINEAFTSKKILCKQESWLFVADFYPGATFAHKVEIGIINNQNKLNPDVFVAKWWPIKIENGKAESLYLDSGKWENINFINFNLLRNITLSYIPSVYRLYISDIPGLNTLPCNTVSKYNLKRAAPVIKKIGTSDDAGNLWAIIVCGYVENSQNSTCYYDAVDMESTLKEYGVRPERRFLFKPDLSSTEELNTKIITCIKDKIKGHIDKDNDKFLFFISTHGKENNLTLQSNTGINSYLDDKTLKGLLDEIPCKTQFVVINACESGSFLTSLIPNTNDPNINRVVITSSYGESFSDLDCLNCDSNYNDRGSEFMSGFIQAFSVSDVNAIPEKDWRNKLKSADKNGDFKVSIEEAFHFAKENSLCALNSMTTRCGFSGLNIPDIRYSNGNTCKFLFWKE